MSCDTSRADGRRADGRVVGIDATVVWVCPTGASAVDFSCEQLMVVATASEQKEARSLYVMASSAIDDEQRARHASLPLRTKRDRFVVRAKWFGG
jgi:hypothetical protein